MSNIEMSIVYSLMLYLGVWLEEDKEEEQKEQNNRIAYECRQRERS